MTSAPILENRRALFEYYESVCSRSYLNLRTDQRLDLDQNLLKSYVIEVHPSKDFHTGRDRFGFLNSILERVHGEAIPSNEETFFNVVRGDQVLHVDALDNRFWIVHANTPAAWTDSFIDGLTRGSSVDVVWFHSEAMEGLSKLGQFLGFSSEYDPRPLGGVAEEQRPGGLVVNFRRILGDARTDFEKLRQPDMFLDEIGISSIRLRFGENGDSEFALADVTHSGKFTERGPSFSAHTALVWTALRSYEERVSLIEREMALTWKQEGNRFKVTGSTIAIQFRPYDRFDVLLEHLFGGRKPFRLWGLPQRNAEGDYSVQAVDLHVGCPLRFDVSNGCIRVYLPDGSCGNTVTRLVTNIQRHVDPRATLIGGEQALAFGSASQSR